MYIGFIFATSNICELLFYTAIYALINRPRVMLPTNTESKILLHDNASNWFVSNFNKVLK